MDVSVANTPSTMPSSLKSTPQTSMPLNTAYDHPPNLAPIPNKLLYNQPPLTSAPSSSITGPITLEPYATPSATLNPRSCVTCRRRKVRCDKYMPCGNCRKAQIQCVFPAPGRAPRRPRAKDPNAPPKHTSEREMELMKRLRKLEGIVEDLSGQIEFETYKHSAANSESPEAATDNVHENERRKLTASPPGESPSLANNTPHPYHHRRRTSTGGSTPGNHANTKGYRVADVNRDFGKLVLSRKGKVGYISNTFWARVTEEIEALRADTEKLTDDSSDSSGDEDSTVTADRQAEHRADHHAFIFGYSSTNVDLRKLHPLPSQMLFYWQVYMDNVDPIIKLLHVPTVTKIVTELRSDMCSITPATEALMFTIYLAAIISMEADEVMTNFGAEKSQLITRYRFATEQALAKANCLTSSDLFVLQAFVLFLILVRRYDPKSSSVLSGLVVKIAQALGLHRDGTHFDNLSLFETEMRRRLWWAICVLDLRSAEDQGCELTVLEQSFDTRFPLNINDSDISADMTEFPPERTGPTDMTFCLIRYEICSISRKLHTAVSRIGPQSVSLEEHEDKLLEMYEHIDQKYLKSCLDETNVLNWVSATLARLIMSKMTLVIYQPLMPYRTSLSSDVRDRLFMASIEVVEYSIVLHVEPKVRRWRWLFQTYHQWHAVAYLLLEVCRRPWSASAERGWVALNAAFQTDEKNEVVRPPIWGLLRKLMIQARRHRDMEILRLRAHPQAAEELDIKEHNKVPPASFNHLPSSVRSSLARERWRKLVGKNSQDPPVTQSCLLNRRTLPETKASTPQQIALKEENTQFNDIEVASYEPYFIPEDVLPLEYPGDPNQFANQDVSNGGASAVQGFNKSPIFPEVFNTRGNATLLPQTRLPMESEVMVMGNEVTNAMPDNNPPPWMWNAAPNYAGYDNVAMMSEDQDINMDTNEVVNWQNWIDSGLGMNGMGFTGGI
ncbi:fungal-specific transcription factor domain-containing protein [Xylaria nigripes]|nr:fungal-specific transcription factor domain-containing protein [Xylaria nigripes]